MLNDPRSAATIGRASASSSRRIGLLRWSTMLASARGCGGWPRCRPCAPGSRILGRDGLRRRGWTRRCCRARSLGSSDPSSRARVPATGVRRAARPAPPMGSAPRSTVLPQIPDSDAARAGGRDGPVILFGGAAADRLSAALMLVAATRRGVGTPRLAAAALALLVLAIVPVDAERSPLSLRSRRRLFVLACGARVLRTGGAGAQLLAGAAIAVVTIGAMAISRGARPPRPVGPGLGDRRHARPGPARRRVQLASELRAAAVAAPGPVVLNVRSAFPYHWKAEDLDLFDGTVGHRRRSGGTWPLQRRFVSAANRARWTETGGVRRRDAGYEIISAGSCGSATVRGRARVPASIADVRARGGSRGRGWRRRPSSAGTPTRSAATRPQPTTAPTSRRAGVALPARRPHAESQMLLRYPSTSGASQIGVRASSRSSSRRSVHGPRWRILRG